jgi:hypothetical protein
VIGFEVERSRRAALITCVNGDAGWSSAMRVAGIATGIVERAVREWLSSSKA